MHPSLCSPSLWALTFDHTLARRYQKMQTVPPWTLDTSLAVLWYYQQGAVIQVKVYLQARKQKTNEPGHIT